MSAEINRKAIQPEGVMVPTEPFSQAVSVNSGQLLFIAGQLAVNEQNETVGIGDIGAQTEQVFKNLSRVLEGVGASFDNVVKFTTFLVQAEDVAIFCEKRREIFAKVYQHGDYPVNTMVVVEQLPNPDWLLEVEAIAALP